jgi:lipopolysaccharide O-acetyltransferase
MLTKILRSLRHERLPYALWALSRLVYEQVTGRLHARLLGWSGGFLGLGGRVIGSRHITVGPCAHINRHAWIEAVHSFRGQSFQPIIRIGLGFSASDRLHITCTHRIDIGDDCLFGSGVYVSDHNHGIYSGADQSAPSEAPVDRALQSSGAVVIGSRVWIGDNVVIVGPLTIGDGAVIGANSVVKHDVPGNAIAAGTPTRVFKRFNPLTGKWEKNEG